MDKIIVCLIGKFFMYVAKIGLVFLLPDKIITSLAEAEQLKFIGTIESDISPLSG